MNKSIVVLTLTVLAVAACGRGRDSDIAETGPFGSRYQALPGSATLLSGATILTGTGERLENADILLQDGKIMNIGKNLKARGAAVVDAGDKWITPGIIDVHSHLGVYSTPAGLANSDHNETTAPNTAEVWVEHSVWPHDPGFLAALAGGVTSLQILPGSSNLFGGRGVTLKNLPGRDVQSMKFPGAPHSLKMACGENPKRIYGGKDQAPVSRMGNVAGYRAAWIAATEYRDKMDRARNDEAEMPTRDLQLETLVGVLNGEILVHNHCYRGDEMSIMLDVAREFGYTVAAFHHAVEAYKVADLLAANNTCAAVWADWWGFKLEAYDGIRENAALVDLAGACTIIHSDDSIEIQQLNQEAAKVMGAAGRAGIDIPHERAIMWITSNAAKALGIDDVVGTLEPGKMADVVLWSGDPFSVYTRAEHVYLDGALVYDRGHPAANPVSDFTLGTSARAGGVK